MNKPIFNKRQILVFRRFGNKGYSLFACLGKVVVCSVLSVSSLTYASTKSVSVRPVPTDSICAIQGLNSTATIYSRPSEQNYWVRSTDVIEPVGGAFSSMAYANGGYSAAIAYPGPGYRVMAFGFPLECIKDDEIRRNIFAIAIDYLLSK